MMFDAILSNIISSSMVIKESDDLPIIPKALIDKLTNVTLEYAGVRSDTREAYFLFLRSLLIGTLDSKPRVNSIMEREELSISNARSGLRESPVMKLGDKNEGRSVHIQQLDKDESVFARKRSTEL